MNCKHCRVILTDENTSCASHGEVMCQDCYTDMLENLGGIAE